MSEKRLIPILKTGHLDARCDHLGAISVCDDYPGNTCMSASNEYCCDTVKTGKLADCSERGTLL